MRRRQRARQEAEAAKVPDRYGEADLAALDSAEELLKELAALHCPKCGKVCASPHGVKVHLSGCKA